MYIINDSHNIIINSDNVIEFHHYKNQISAHVKDYEYEIVLMQNKDEDNVEETWSSFICSLKCDYKIFDFGA